MGAREFFIEDLLVRIHFIIVMIRWIGIAPWEFELHFQGSLTSTFLGFSLDLAPCETSHCLQPLSIEFGTYKTVKAAFWP